MNRRSLIFEYRHTTLGLTIFALGFGVLLCTTLEAMGVGLLYRHMTAGLLMALSGAFVRRDTPAATPAAPPG